MKVRNARAQATDPGIAGPWKPYQTKDVSTQQADKLLAMAGFQAVDPEPDTPGHGATVVPAKLTDQDQIKAALDTNYKKTELVAMAKTLELDITKGSKAEYVDAIAPAVKLEAVQGGGP